MDNKIDILVVDDRPENLLLLEHILADQGYNIIKAGSGEQALALLLDYDIALVLLDVQMSGMNGYETAELMRGMAKTQHVPIIFVTAISEEKKHIYKGYQVGAIDFLFKPLDPDILRCKVHIFAELHCQRRLIETQNKRLEELATTDSLTGLCNRRVFLDAVKRECGRSQRHSDPTSIAFFDLDRFKSINDSHGHGFGDRVLKELADVLRHGSRVSDLPCRYAGDEFALLMPNTSSPEAVLTTDRIRQQFCDLIIDTDTWSLKASITGGVSTCDAGSQIEAEELVRRADEAMYSAKVNGGNCVQAWNSDCSQQTETDDTETIRALRAKMDRMASMSQEMLIRSVRSLVEALDARDPYTRSHSHNVTHFATGIARKMNLASEQLSLIRRAAIVHDIGKIGIPDSILRKPGSLSQTERSRMEDHVIIGVRILDPLHTMNDELPIVRSHHERMDGQGYPYGLAGDEIPLGGRILCVADAFDAITSNRVYRPGRSIARAIEVLTSDQGKQFDVDVVDALLEWIGEYGDPEQLTVTDMLVAKTTVSVPHTGL